MAKQNSFDQFQESLENFDPDQYQAKEASYTYDEDFLGALDPEVANRFKQASEELDPELKAFADSVAFMEAVNLQKQANYIQQTIGGSEMFLNPKNKQANDFDMANLHAMADGTYKKPHITASQFKQMQFNKDLAAAMSAHETSEGLNQIGNLGDVGHAYAADLQGPQLLPPKNHAMPGTIGNKIERAQHKIGQGVQKGRSAAEAAMAYLAANKGKYMAGAGAVGGAGALGAAIRSRRNAALQQGIGKAILGHLARNKGKYGLAAGAGALAAGGLYAKQASEEQIYVADLADTTYQFVQNLYNRNLSSYLAEESTTWEKAASYALENQY